jgi:hypothetical protein
MPLVFDSEIAQVRFSAKRRKTAIMLCLCMVMYACHLAQSGHAHMALTSVDDAGHSPLICTPQQAYSAGCFLAEGSSFTLPGPPL